jgi:hypothetical protein
MAETQKLGEGVKAVVTNGRTSYTNAKGERVKSDGSPFAKRGEGEAAKKRPAYVVYKAALDGTTGQPNGDIEIINVSRNAEEVLAAIDGDTTHTLKYKRTEI